MITTIIPDTRMTTEILTHLGQLDSRLALVGGPVLEAVQFITSRHLQRQTRSLGVLSKGKNDLVTEVDKGSEAIVSEGLRSLFPEIPFLGEEFGLRESGTSLPQTYWILDPIDGTTNFSHGFPQFSVSLALIENKEPVIALVVEVVRNEWFYAVRGKGAYLNGTPIRVSDCGFSETLIATGFPISDFSHLSEFQSVLSDVIRQNHGVRRAGSAASDLAYTACGRFNGYWEYGLKPWDIAAGILLVREAGGKVTDYSGEDFCLENGQVVAGAPSVYGELFKIVSGRYSSYLKQKPRG